MVPNLQKFQNTLKRDLQLKSLTLKSNSAVKIRSLLLFDLEPLIIEANNEVLKLMVEWGLSNRTDISNLFIYSCLKRILNLYKTNKGGFLCFYLNDEKYVQLTTEKYDVNYKKFFKVVMKTVKFPIVISTLPFETFLVLMMSDCPEYDELLDSNKLFSSVVPDLIKVIKKLKFYKLEEEFSKNLKEQIKCISLFSA